MENSIPPRPAALAGRSVVLVEDDYFVAQECAAALRLAGARVLGPVPDLAGARATVRESNPDCAVLDINLKGELAFELAEEILNEGIPVVLTTGYDPSVLPSWLRQVPMLQKPIDMRELIDLVRAQIDDSLCETSAR